MTAELSRPGRKRPPLETLEAMARTMTRQEIAEATGASLGIVSRWVIEFGLAPQRSKRPAGRPRSPGHRATMLLEYTTVPSWVYDLARKPWGRAAVEGRVRYWGRA